MIDPDRTRLVLNDVLAERERQEQLVIEGRYPSSAADPELSNYVKLTVLAEEVGEVAQEVSTLAGRRQCRGTLGTPEALRKELVQVAAIAVAWIEALS